MLSQRNPRSIQVFLKAGFINLNLAPDEGKNEFGFQDYFDSDAEARNFAASLINL